MNSLEFAAASKRLGQATRASGYTVPIFRGPPRRPGVNRSITRSADAVTVAVVLARRPVPAVMADMIEGIVSANALTGGEASRLRDALWEATADLLVDASHHVLAA